ncbi:MAG: DUF1858 domain-containing protein [Caldilineaceae bacterium]|nr:DUF1858 domain-containing protein [Caldilineaceae bacterium]
MEQLIQAELTVAETLERWPQTIPVFLRRRMACVGCPVTPFETLAEAAVIYEIDLPRFLNDLRQSITSQEANM